MQRFFKGLLILWSLSLWMLTSCRKGELLENTPPETELFVRSIELTGENRLTSSVRLYWFGSDANGFVKGYEISRDNSNWTFLSITDSTFLFSIASGNDTVDIDFYVRSIDNDNQADPTPAYLKIPIRNTPPTANYASDYPKTDSVNSIFALAWSVTDADGPQTIDSVFLKANEGPWIAIRRNTNLVKVRPVELTTTGITAATLRTSISNSPSFLVENERTESQPLQGLKIGDWNTFYIKAKDIAGAFSETDTLAPFYLKPKRSDLLIIQSHDGTSPQPHPIYRDQFDQMGMVYDDLNMFKNGATNEIRFWNYTFEDMLLLYDRIFWYTSQSGQAKFRGQELFIEKASLPLQLFLSKPNSKLMISASLPHNLDPNSRLYLFTPMDSIRTFVAGQQARLFSGYRAFPAKVGFDTLTVSVPNITAAAPFYLKPSADTLYTAQLLASGGWVGPSIIGAALKNPQGRLKFVFFSLELHKFNSNPQALRSTFQRIWQQEFNW
jgi:hypothetical protein